MNMETKIVTRNLNFDTSARDSKSRYRVKFGDSRTFDTLKVICNYGGKSKIYETSSNNLPKGKDSIYFLADKVGDTFVINWSGEASKFMNEV